MKKFFFLNIIIIIFLFLFSKIDNVDEILSLYKATLNDKVKENVLNIDCFKTVSSALGRAGKLAEMLEVYEEAQKVKFVVFKFIF